ncbi:MAG TPA: metallopeptidase family protein [Candidatus Saccharimonadales bacterium]
MLTIDDHQFETLIATVMDELPSKYAENMNNVAITWAEEPTLEQRQKMKLRSHETLFGLYEGIPLTQRGGGYNLVLPDKITIFKMPIISAVSSFEQLKAQVKHTLWHELAHHFGLEHVHIYEAEERYRQKQQYD